MGNPGGKTLSFNEKGLHAPPLPLRAYKYVHEAPGTSPYISHGTSKLVTTDTSVCLFVSVLFLFFSLS